MTTEIEETERRIRDAAMPPELRYLQVPPFVVPDAPTHRVLSMGEHVEDALDDVLEGRGYMLRLV